MVLVTQTTSRRTTTTTSTTTTVIPALSAGVSRRRHRAGRAGGGDGVLVFRSRPRPSGGVPPYTFTWNFGDGAEGAGAAPTHLYMNTGIFTVTATATDSRGMTAQASTGCFGPQRDRADGSPPSRRRPGCNARADRSGAEPDGGDRDDQRQRESAGIRVRHRHRRQSAFAGGQRDLQGRNAHSRSASPSSEGSMKRWRSGRGTVTGYAGCPCTFTATQPARRSPSSSHAPVASPSGHPVARSWLRRVEGQRTVEPKTEQPRVLANHRRRRRCTARSRRFPSAPGSRCRSSTFQKLRSLGLAGMVRSRLMIRRSPQLYDAITSSPDACASVE